MSILFIRVLATLAVFLGLVQVAGDELEYAFEVNDWEISPTFDVDFVDGDTVLIGGMLFGFGF